MPYYINNSPFVKTFYGVEFKPGEVHSIPGYINSKGMFRVKDVPIQNEPEDITTGNVFTNLATDPIEIPCVEEPKISKRGRGRKSKDVSENNANEVISEEPILSENIIEEGEEN